MREKIAANWRTWLLIIAVVNLMAVDVLMAKVIRDTGYVIRNMREADKKQIGTDNKRIQADDKESLLGSKPVVTPVVLPTGILDTCGLACQQKIAEEVAQEVARAMATVSGQKVVETKTVVKEVAPTLSNEQAKVVYIPLVASASNTNTNWIDVIPSEFYFDLASYPGAKTVRFTGYLRAVHATGPVYVRLYDVSNNRGVDNSDFSTSSNTSQRFESAALSIWRGNNLYRVQLRSPTATEAQLSEVKLKVEW